MKNIGTILPTEKSLAISEQFAVKEAAKRGEAARKLLPSLSPFVVGGEVRYYKTKTVYAVIGRDFLPRRFEVRADGDYPIK